MVQAGPNSQFGGLKDGFSRPTYQPGIALAVTIPLAKPRARITTMLMMVLKNKLI
jgi:hypothetical protein